MYAMDVVGWGRCYNGPYTSQWMLEAILELANMIMVDATQWMVWGGMLKFIELANMVNVTLWMVWGGGM